MAKHPPKKFKKTGGGKVKSLKPSHTSIPATNFSKKERVILDTLNYRQIFGCPMTVFQIWTYLLTIDQSPKQSPGNPVNSSNAVNSASSGKSVNRNNAVDPTNSTNSVKPPNPDDLIKPSVMSPQEFRQALAQLVKSGTVIEKSGLYSLGKVDYENYAQNQTRAKELIFKANAVTNYLKKIPWIEMVALTGDVSAFNADNHADIDILIVTKPRRLFLSRFFLVVILKLLGVYWNAKNPAGKVCPNIFMTSDAMTWEAKNQNLYTANEVSLLYPLYSRNNCYFDFLAQNAWVADYLPNLIIPETNPQSIKRTATGKLLDLVEFLTRTLQLAHMKKKRTKEIITNDFLHFNIHDRTHDILSKMK